MGVRVHLHGTHFQQVIVAMELFESGRWQSRNPSHSCHARQFGRFLEPIRLELFELRSQKFQQFRTALHDVEFGRGAFLPTARMAVRFVKIQVDRSFNVSLSQCNGVPIAVRVVAEVDLVFADDNVAEADLASCGSFVNNLNGKIDPRKGRFQTLLLGKVYTFRQLLGAASLPLLLLFFADRRKVGVRNEPNVDIQVAPADARGAAVNNHGFALCAFWLFVLWLWFL